MIIVEGPDGGGKTTLVKRLREDLGLPVSERIVSKNTEMMGDLKTWVEDNLMQGPQAMIFDRHRLISEPIYGPVLRQQPQPGFEDEYWLRSRLERFYQLEPLLIYCIPPLATVEKNLRDDEDNAAVYGARREIYWLYLYQWARDAARGADCIRWNYTDEFEVSYLMIERWVRDWLWRKGFSRT